MTPPKHCFGGVSFLWYFDTQSKVARERLVETPRKIISAKALALVEKVPDNSFLRYVISCSTCAVPGIAISWFLVVVGVPFKPATALGYALQVLAEYLVNRSWVFKRSVNLYRGLAIAAIGELLAAWVLMSVTTLGVEQLRWPYVCARVLAGFAAWCVGYAYQGLITFRMYKR